MTVELKEIKCSTKQNIGLFLRNGRLALLGGGPAPASDHVVFSGLGAAIPVCIATAARLEKDKIANIQKVETGMIEITGEQGKVRNVCQLRVFVSVRPEARTSSVA